MNKIPDNYQGVTEEELCDLLEFCCRAEDSSMLEACVTEEEIIKALFAMPSNKSLGPDGYPCEFFKSTWLVLAHNFTVAV